MERSVLGPLIGDRSRGKSPQMSLPHLVKPAVHCIRKRSRADQSGTDGVGKNGGKIYTWAELKKGELAHAPCGLMILIWEES